MEDEVQYHGAGHGKTQNHCEAAPPGSDGRDRESTSEAAEHRESDTCSYQFEINP